MSTQPVKAWRVEWAPDAVDSSPWVHYFRRWIMAFAFAVKLSVDHGGHATVKQVALAPDGTVT